MESSIFNEIQSALICTLDINGKILSHNMAFRKFFAIDENFRGSFLDLIDVSDHPLFLDLFKRVVKSNEHHKDVQLCMAGNERFIRHKIVWEIFMDDENKRIVCVAIVTEAGEHLLFTDNIFTLESVLTLTNESSILLSKDVRVEFFSKQAYEDVKKFFGKAIRVGDDFDQYIVPELRELFYEKFHEALNGKEIYYEINVPIGTEEGFWFFIKFLPIKSAVGEIASVLYSARNINDIKKYERELSEQKFYLKAMYDSADTAIGVFDRKFKILYLNKKASEIIVEKFGKIPKTGDLGYDFFYPDQQIFFYTKVESALQGSTEIFEFEDGNQVWRFKIFPIYDENMNIVGVSVHISEITKLKEYERKIIQQVDYLKKLAWSQSHELRGPLSSILAISENIELIQDESLRNFALTSIKKYADSMDVIIRQTVTSINKITDNQ